MWVMTACVGGDVDFFTADGDPIYQANGSNAKPMAPTCAESSEMAAPLMGMKTGEELRCIGELRCLVT